MRSMMMTSTAKAAGKAEHDRENTAAPMVLNVSPYRPYCTLWLALHQIFPMFGQR